MTTTPSDPIRLFPLPPATVREQRASDQVCTTGAWSSAAAEAEQERLAALERYDVLDSPKEEAFDRITRLAKKLFRVRYVVITMVDAHRSWSKSAQGLEITEAPRNISFCQHTIREERLLVVPDAAVDPRFADNPFVRGEPHIRFYVGVPLAMSDGHNIGTLCIFETEPRDFSDEDAGLLTDLGKMVVDELELRLLATRDCLTGALSRRAFKEEAERAAALSLRHHHDLSVVAIDLDRFKTINDTYGHPAGDAVLRSVVDATRRRLRETDLLGRLGGEEFAVLLPNTSEAGALEVAEKLRTAVNGQEVQIGPSRLTVTASFGIASLDRNTRDAETLLGHADAALYEAKAAGRDRCATWRSLEQPNAQQLRRVLKGGQILFNGGTSVIDCTVRGLSENGAAIDVSTTVGIPKSFTLAIAADSVEKPCRILSQSEKRIEVEFFEEPERLSARRA